MSMERWSQAITRITRQEADPIDDLVAPFDPRLAPEGAAGRAVFPEDVAPARPDPAFADPATVCVGVRIDAPQGDPAALADLAMRLTMLAMDRGCEVVVLSHLPYCGLERFGFRCERVTGETDAARAACEAQLRRFWNMDLVI